MPKKKIELLDEEDELLDEEDELLDDSPVEINDDLEDKIETLDQIKKRFEKIFNSINLKIYF